MEPRPYSPETAFVTSSLEAWNRFFSTPDDLDSVDSDHQSLSTSEDSECFTDDSLDDANLSVIRTPTMPPKCDQTYEELAYIMGFTYLELTDIVRLLDFYVRSMTYQNTGHLSLGNFRR